MPIQKLPAASEIPSPQLEDWGAVSVPIGDVISRLRGIILSANEDGSEAGIWECTPGTWVRQVMDAEFCTFLSGHAIFTPENREPIEIRAGDVVYFPRESKGTWQILETVRKTYLTSK
jgi:uncharacterized cupin superfamily protein